MCLKATRDFTPPWLAGQLSAKIGGPTRRWRPWEGGFARSHRVPEAAPAAAGEQLCRRSIFHRHRGGATTRLRVRACATPARPGISQFDPADTLAQTRAVTTVGTCNGGIYRNNRHLVTAPYFYPR